LKANDAEGVKVSNAESYFTGTGIVLLVIYFVPAIVASVRKHRQTMAIVVLDLFLGWTLLGWVAALVWACTADTKTIAPKKPPAIWQVALFLFGLILFGRMFLYH
jgi:threonine/homoserine/homoserine lactone efflux protein